MFGKSKDLEVLFLNRFKPIGTKFTSEQVKEVTVQAAKSLLKNKKKSIKVQSYDRAEFQFLIPTFAF